MKRIGKNRRCKNCNHWKSAHLEGDDECLLWDYREGYCACKKFM